MKTLTKVAFLIITLISSTVWSQDQSLGKHPKVIEIEMMITKEATSFLLQRIPKGPVYVNVEIEPLRRNADVKNEQLPYFYSEDEVGDEWDVIDTPMVLLLSRIKKATIKVEVPNNISDLELIDLKEKLYEQLKLIPGRDKISIERKLKPANINENKDYTLYYFIAGMSIIIFAGLFILLRFGSKSSANTSPSTSPSAAASSASVTSAPSQMPMRQGSHGGKFSPQSLGNINSNVHGDITFKDSIRAADMLKEKLHGVVNSPIFPLLSDMLILEGLADKSLSSFGAFVFEMPRKHQQKIFFRGRSDKWFKGYVEASSLDMDSFVAVEKMLRSRTPTGSEKWEELLIQVWRLDEEAHLFLKQIPADNAFAILAQLPKTLAVPTAKKAFPGGWARVLETKENNPIDDESKIEDYLDRALQVKPYFNFKSIDEYRKDLELVDYLRIASVKDEEDIYESLASASTIHNIRPPFYAIFKAEDDDFKRLFVEFELYDWAIAMINSPRSYMKRITNELDDKKRYLLSNFLRQLDENQVPIKEQVELREEIAKKYHQMMLYKKSNLALLEKEAKEEGNENTPQAA